MLSQCPQCGLSKSSGAMGSVLPQCRCDWKMPTPQRTWVGLTDDEIDKAWRSVDYTVPREQHRIDIAQAIEAKLKEKNND